MPERVYDLENARPKRTEPQASAKRLLRDSCYQPFMTLDILPGNTARTLLFVIKIGLGLKPIFERKTGVAFSLSTNEAEFRVLALP